MNIQISEIEQPVNQPVFSTNVGSFTRRCDNPIRVVLSRNPLMDVPNMTNLVKKYMEPLLFKRYLFEVTMYTEPMSFRFLFLAIDEIEIGYIINNIITNGNFWDIYSVELPSPDQIQINQIHTKSFYSYTPVCLYWFESMDDTPYSKYVYQYNHKPKAIESGKWILPYDVSFPSSWF